MHNNSTHARISAIFLLMFLLQNLFCNDFFLCACKISLLKPCPRCEAPPYGFQNVMSLSKDTHKFAVSLIIAIQHH